MLVNYSCPGLGNVKQGKMAWRKKVKEQQAHELLRQRLLVSVNNKTDEKMRRIVSDLLHVSTADSNMVVRNRQRLTRLAESEGKEVDMIFQKSDRDILLPSADSNIHHWKALIDKWKAEVNERADHQVVEPVTAEIGTLSDTRNAANGMIEMQRQDHFHQHGAGTSSEQAETDIDNVRHTTDHGFDAYAEEHGDVPNSNTYHHQGEQHPAASERAQATNMTHSEGNDISVNQADFFQRCKRFYELRQYRQLYEEQRKRKAQELSEIEEQRERKAEELSEIDRKITAADEETKEMNKFLQQNLPEISQEIQKKKNEAKHQEQEAQSRNKEAEMMRRVVDAFQKDERA